MTSVTTSYHGTIARNTLVLFVDLFVTPASVGYEAWDSPAAHGMQDTSIPHLTELPQSCKRCIQGITERCDNIKRL